tara:strand:- start:74529 stop:75098 length:570 start_codon:yes stop_codon:yes gene_type:complete
MAFRIGDKVQILDEEGEGVITGFKSNNVVTVELDGFPFDYAITHLIKVVNDNQVVHNADKRSFEHLLKEGSVNGKKEVLMHIPMEVFDKVNSRGFPEIDLHIHELVDKPKSLTNGEMLEIQIQRLERFIQSCIEKSVSEFVVIHGVGQGVLKIEIRKVLDSHGNIRFRDADFNEYGAGATHARILGLFS